MKKNGGKVMVEGLLITLLGMGSVFYFLFLMICCMHVLGLLGKSSKKTELEKIAVSIAVAQRSYSEK